MTSSHKTLIVWCIAKTLCTLACIIGAVVLIKAGIDGWGWLLFVSILVAPGQMKLNSGEGETQS